MKIFFDGGWRPASGMETAVVVHGRDYVRQGLGPGSAMDAEWLALLHAVELAADLGLHEAVFLGDSLAVVGQANGTARCPRDHVRHRQALAALQPLRNAGGQVSPFISLSRPQRTIQVNLRNHRKSMVVDGGTITR